MNGYVIDRGWYMDFISLLPTIFQLSPSPLAVSVSLKTVHLVEAIVPKGQLVMMLEV